MKSEKILQIPLECIRFKNNHREVYDEQKTVELMTAMKQVGLLQPIGVTNNLEEGLYDVVWGHRRFVAAQKLGWQTVGAVITECKNDEEFTVKNLIENVVRHESNLIEQGRAYHDLLLAGLTPSEIAARVGVGPSKVRKAVQAYKQVPEKYRGKINVGTSGAKLKKGKIPGSMAIRIENTVRGLGLDAAAKDSLYEAAQQDNFAADKLRVVAFFLQKGWVLKDAIKEAESTKIVRTYFAMRQSEVARLELESGESIQSLFEACLDLTFKMVTLRKINKKAFLKVTSGVRF